MITPPVSPPERYKNPLDYVLVAGTCVLFVIYLPLFAAAPRLSHGVHNLELHWYLHLFWVLPLVMMLSSMFALFRWAVHGATNVLRMLWFVTLSLAGMGVFVAYPVVILM